MLPRYRFSPSSTEFKAALRLVFKEQEQTWGALQADQAPRTAARPVPARGKREAQGVQSQLVRGRKWTNVGEQKQTGYQRREAIYTVRTTANSHRRVVLSSKVPYQEAGSALPQSWSKKWKRGVLEITMHTGSEKKTRSDARPYDNKA